MATKKTLNWFTIGLRAEVAAVCDRLRNAYVLLDEEEDLRKLLPDLQKAIDELKRFSDKTEPGGG